MSIIERFFREATATSIEAFIEWRGFGEFTLCNTDLFRNDFFAVLRNYFAQLPKTQRETIRIDVERMYLMTDKRGQRVLGRVINYQADYLEQVCAVDRAIWVYINTPQSFKRAEQLRRLEKVELGRHCCQFKLQQQVPLQTEEDKVSLFQEGLHLLFPVHRKILVEVFDPVFVNSDEIYNLGLYFENPPTMINELEGETVCKRITRKVSEFSLCFDKSSGILSIFTYRREYAHPIASLFSVIFLNQGIYRKTTYSGKFDLRPLLQKYNLPLSEDDGLKSLDLEMLKLENHNDHSSFTLESKISGLDFNSKHQNSHFKTINNLVSLGYVPTYAKINLHFEANRYPENSTLPITIAAPDRCDLYRRTSQERKLGEKNLKQWGLMA